MRARPLHRYRMMGYEIVATEQMDLHLLKMSSKILVKPLPDWILGYEFWETWICGDKELHRSACGFLLSYVWLLVTPIDLKIAIEFGLIPSCITWPWWKSFVHDFLADEPGRVDINTLAQVNQRYQFGDLRLGRINSIYRSRFFWTHFVRGYLYGYNRYVVFFQRKFGWLLIVGVFFSLVSLPSLLSLSSLLQSAITNMNTRSSAQCKSASPSPSYQTNTLSCARVTSSYYSASLVSWLCWP
jgi:hypothetical protein